MVGDADVVQEERGVGGTDWIPVRARPIGINAEMAVRRRSFLWLISVQEPVAPAAASLTSWIWAEISGELGSLL